MNQFFTMSPVRTLNGTKTRQTLVGLAAVVALLFGSLAATAQGATPKTLVLTAAQNGKVITVNPGEHIDVSLTDAHWTFSTEGARSVVKLLTWSTVPSTGKTSGATHACVPGTTCTVATTLAQYFALEPGLMRLIGRLTICPTGTTCSSAESFWTAVIRVR